MTGDRWASWLLSRRDGDDDGLKQQYAPMLLRLRDGVLERAAITDGDTVVDVGTGTGMIGFGALEQVGAGGRVVFSDISDDLLAECRRLAGDDERCSFVRAAADDLSVLPSGSADVVTTRSVLIYVVRKASAFAEFFRILRPGGRLSIFEPINRFAAGETLFGYDLTPVDDLVRKVRDAHRSVDAEEVPMVDFDERDLLRFARSAGFTAITMDYRAEVDVPAPTPRDWDVVKRTAPNPHAPTYGEAMVATLTTAEQQRFDDYMRSLIDGGTPARRTLATVFLSAVRP
jgi:arsenite methyltransferase